MSGNSCYLVYLNNNTRCTRNDRKKQEIYKYISTHANFFPRFVERDKHVSSSATTLRFPVSRRWWQHLEVSASYRADAPLQYTQPLHCFLFIVSLLQQFSNRQKRSSVDIGHISLAITHLLADLLPALKLNIALM